MQPDTERATLKAILFADLQQYARMTAANELETLDFVTRCFQTFQEHCQGFGGEFVKTTGDGVLILFDSASSAVDYAMSIQAELGRQLEARPDYGKFRIGLHMGEVRRRGQDVFGHAVNMASRVEAKAPPGGVCVTQEVFSATRNATRYGFRFAGRPALKGMPELVSLYHVSAEEKGDATGRQLVISVIDGLTLGEGDGGPVELRSHEAQALIGHLALSSQYQARQDRVATLIWPDRSLAEARRTLNARMHALEKAITRDADKRLFHRGGVIGLNPALVVVDVIHILDDLGDGRVDDLLLNRADSMDSILAGFEDVSSLFSAWLSVTRHNRRDAVMEALEAILERFAVSEPALRRAATALLMLEPSHERAAQYLIRHYAAAGNVSSAMRVYDGIATILKERFQMSPSEATTALVQHMAGTAKTADKPLDPRRPGPRKPGIAVGRFVAHAENLAAAASGFRSELIANLSKFREWTVVETEDGQDNRDHDYSVTAECMGGDDGIKLYVTLTDPRMRRIVWSDSFDLALANWTSALKRLVARIASTLEVYISQDRLSRILSGPAGDLAAYDAWLRGEHLLTRWSPTAEDEAEKLFERAIADDPHFAPAHASLASVYNARHLIRPGIAADAELARRALALAERAIEIDPLDARSQLVVAWSTAMMRRFEQSELHYILAAELNPNSPRTLVSAALGLAFMGRAELAKSLLERATTLTSHFLDYQWCHIATIRFFLGDMEGVVEAAERSNNVIVDTSGWKAAAQLRLGRRDAARETLAQLNAAVTAIWEGSAAMQTPDVLVWFLQAFPIRREEDRALLAGLLEIG